MKTAPLGYKIELGHYEILESEAIIVRNIFELYENGVSLSKISAEVIDKYSLQTLNKSKINRILCDERYTGKDLFPAIIDRKTFDRVNNKKNDGTKRTTESVQLSGIKLPFTCSECGGVLKRIRDNRLPCPERWKCEECKKLILFKDQTLINEFQSMLKSAALDYSADNSSTIVRSMDMVFKEKLIEEALSSEAFDKEKIKNDILKLAEMKINSISRTAYIQNKIKDSLAKFESISDLAITINAIAKEICILSNQSVEMQFLDNTKYCKDTTGIYSKQINGNKSESVTEITGT